MLLASTAFFCLFLVFADACIPPCVALSAPCWELWAEPGGQCGAKSSVQRGGGQRHVLAVG